MRRTVAPLVTAGVLAAIVLATALSLPLAPLRAQDTPSPCVTTAEKIVAPDVMLLGETTRITMTLQGRCEDNRVPLHLVLVLDASGSMAGQPNQQLHTAGEELVRSLDLPNNPGDKVGVVQFSDDAEVLCELTNDETDAVRCVRDVEANGLTAINRGIDEGLGVLDRGRGGLTELLEVMVVLSDGTNTADGGGCAPVIRASNIVKRRGIFIATVCLGPQCDVSCMRETAADDRYAFTASEASELGATFEQIRADISEITFRELTIVDRLPDTVRLLPSSVSPPPSSFGTGRDLTWELTFLPDTGITIGLTVEPLVAGDYPVNLSAEGSFVDNKNRVGEFSFDSPWISVMEPRVVPTPFEPTPTPTPTATPTPVPEPVYLPILLKEKCDPEQFFADVALVLDMSTSMNEPTASGRSKLAAVLDAAETFVELIDLSPDEDGRHAQVAVVGFNNEAWIQRPMSNDRGLILQALRALPERQDPGTRLDLAFARGAEALRSAARKPENTQTLILLTDGLPTNVPPADDGSVTTTVLRAAAAAKQAGAVVYTIGVGRTDPDAPPAERIDADLLRAAASDPSKFFREPDAEQLDAVYQAIIGTLGCPPGRHPWWGEEP